MSPKNQSPQKPPNNYLKYGGMAFQMFAVIGIGSFGGMKLDQYYKTSTPIFTIILSLLSIFASLYLVLKDFINPKS